MQASETTSPRKRFNGKTINNQAINNAGGVEWEGKLPHFEDKTLFRHQFCIHHARKREDVREQDWVPVVSSSCCHLRSLPGDSPDLMLHRRNCECQVRARVVLHDKKRQIVQISYRRTLLDPFRKRL